MAYQVLARKWRPQTFAEVVGQEHITRTLKNAIIHNRIGHAYLFVGSRGIGKTTTARIFAKALNCSHNVDGEPCCKCENCIEATNGNAMDIIEIDGASHNKVEDVRDIRDNVQYAPTKGKYKIYIIDEVHMLTPQAWNALLKTLEEPPPHVKFLFATTEPHKVLPTIISRCQRFDMKRIPVPLIVARLRQIASGEHISIDDEALGAIARAADGGMRDAQSIFDQMIAFCGGQDETERITEQDVIDVFGLASGVELRAIASAIFTNDLSSALQVLRKLAESGRDLERLYGDLINYVRNIMVASLCSDADGILEVSETELTDLLNIGKALNPQVIQRALQALVAQEWSFRAALNKRIYFEATLAKVIMEANSVQLDDIFTFLNRSSGALPPGNMPMPHPTPVIPPPPAQPPKKAEASPAKPAPMTPGENITQAHNQPATPGENITQAHNQPPTPPTQPETPPPQPAVPPTQPAVPPTQPETPPSQPATPPPQPVTPPPQPVTPPTQPAVPPTQPETPPPQPATPAPEPISTFNINDMLMEASAGMSDSDEDGDPALEDTNVSSVMEAYTPGAVHSRLTDALAGLGNDGVKLSDMLGTFQASELGQYGLTLTYQPELLSPEELEYLNASKTKQLIERAFKNLHLSGTVRLSAAQGEQTGDKIKYRHANFLEIQRMNANPLIHKVNQALGTSLIDVRIPDEHC